jgi:hypothetical protein
MADFHYYTHDSNYPIVTGKFKVGQKVLCVDGSHELRQDLYMDGKEFRTVMGKIYTVTGVRKFRSGCQNILELEGFVDHRHDVRIGYNEKKFVEVE